MSEPVLTYSVQECRALLQRLESSWVSFGDSECDRTPGFADLFERIVTNVAQASTTNQYQRLVGDVREQVAQLFLRLTQHGALADDQLLSTRMDRVMQVISYAVVIVNGAHRAQQAIDSNSEPVNIASSFYTFSSMTGLNQDDLNSYQRLLLHLCSQAQMHGYRRYGDAVYEPLITPDGHNTHSWKQVCDIRAFVFRSCQKEFFFNEWLLLTDKTVHCKNAVTYLTECEDYQFPRLQKDRHATSYTNGIYLAERELFAPFNSGLQVPSGLCCAKHFDAAFPEADYVSAAAEWADIPTPALDSILHSQELDNENGRWLYVFLGRLLYEVGELDNW